MAVKLNKNELGMKTWTFIQLIIFSSCSHDGRGDITSAKAHPSHIFLIVTFYWPLERGRKVGSVTAATAWCMMYWCTCTPDTSATDHATDVYVAYANATVGTYPHLLHLSPFLVSSTVLCPLHKKGPIGMGRTNDILIEIEEYDMQWESDNIIYCN